MKLNYLELADIIHLPSGPSQIHFFFSVESSWLSPKLCPSSWAMVVATMPRTDLKSELTPPEYLKLQMGPCIAFPTTPSSNSTALWTAIQNTNSNSNNAQDVYMKYLMLRAAKWKYKSTNNINVISIWLHTTFHTYLYVIALHKKFI